MKHEQGDTICHENDGCPTEGAVLKREWRAMRKEIAWLQAKIDALMLEHCPDEMTDEQRENWAKHQRPTTF